MPRLCEAGMPANPAVSLFDHATKICPLCAAFELATIQAGGRLEAPGFEWTGNRIEPMF